jgi:drug/metabolite transporter (DMT)-like permease
VTTIQQAVLLAALAAFLFTAETVVVKAVQGVPIATLVLVRALGQLCWTLPSLARHGAGLVRTRTLPMHLFRGALSVTSWFMYYVSFTGLPLATATVLAFSAVLFVVALAGPALGERVDRARWIATLVGFLGVLVVVRPGAVPLDWPVAAALGSAFVSALTVVTTKMLARSERTQTIMFYIGVVSVAVALPVAWPGLAWPGWGNAGLLLLAGILGPLAMHVWIASIRLADASLLAPVGYLRLIFAAGFGLALFAEVPEIWLLPGAALILGSALYITRREAALARQAPRAEAATRQAPRAEAATLQAPREDAARAASSGAGSSPKSR